MGVYELCRRFGWEGEVSERSAEVMRMFGLTVDRMAEQGVEHKCSLDIRGGDVVFITGASGAGKSVLLRELAGRLGVGVWIWTRLSCMRIGRWWIALAVSWWSVCGI